MARGFEYYRNNEEAYMWMITNDPIADWDSYCEWCEEAERMENCTSENNWDEIFDDAWRCFELSRMEA